MVERSKKAELKISGMTCAMCVQTIESALGNIDAVSSANVNLGTETATVKYDPEKVNLKDLEKAVNDTGYEVINERAVLKIGDMTCAMCVQTIEGALGGLDGVVDVSVNLGAEKAYVKYNPRMITIADMKTAIEDTGYRYLGLEGEDTGDLETEIREKDLKMKGFPLIGSSYRPAQFVHTKLKNIEVLYRSYPEPLIYIHPEDAAKRGIKQGDRVEVTSPQGEAAFRATLSENTKAGMVWIDFGWGNPTDGKANINTLTNDTCFDPVSGGTPNRLFACEISKQTEGV